MKKIPIANDTRCKKILTASDTDCKVTNCTRYKLQMRPIAKGTDNKRHNGIRTKKIPQYDASSLNPHKDAICLVPRTHLGKYVRLKWLNLNRKRISQTYTQPGVHTITLTQWCDQIGNTHTTTKPHHNNAFTQGCNLGCDTMELE